MQVEDQTHDQRAHDSRRNGPSLQQAQDPADGPGAEHNAADGAAHRNQATEADAEHKRKGQCGPNCFHGHYLKVQQANSHHRGDNGYRERVAKVVSHIYPTVRYDLIQICVHRRRATRS